MWRYFRREFVVTNFRMTQTRAMESVSKAMLLLYPLVQRFMRFSLSLKRECSPSFRFPSLPLPTTCLCKRIMSGTRDPS